MNTQMIAAIAGGLVIGAAAMVPMGGVAAPAPPTATSVTGEKTVAPSDGDTEEEITAGTEVTSGTAGTAGTAGTSGTGYSFNQGGDDDDDEDDEDDEDDDDDDEEDEDDD